MKKLMLTIVCLALIGTLLGGAAFAARPIKLTFWTFVDAHAD